MRCCASVSTAMLLCACTVGPNFEPPKPPDSPAWRDRASNDPATDQSTNPNPRWWQQFGDPTLTSLIETAIRGNLDLQQAVLRVVEARQGVVAARAAGLPTLGATGSYRREQLGARGILESQGVYGDLNALADQNSPLNQFASGLGTQASSALGKALNPVVQPTNLFQYGLDASWQLDLFGRVRRSVEQAEASAEAQREATNDALVMLEGEVAQAYIQLRGAQALTASQQDNIRSAQNAVLLTDRLQRQGLGTALDVDQARAQLQDLERQLPAYEKQQQQMINQLNVLIGQPPGALDARLNPPAPIPALPQVVGLGVPSTLARRRPDIRQAEAQLHAATANVGVAVASFYPDISLTGDIGIRAIDASYLTNWASHFYGAGPSISLPIFQGGRLTANLRLARAQAIESALRYRGTVLNALREVEDDLVAYRTDRAERDRLAEMVRSNEDAFGLADNRFRHGLENFLRVLDAQRTLNASRQQLVQAQVALGNDVIALYRALGGGWEDPGAQITAPEVPQAPPIAPAALDSLAAP